MYALKSMAALTLSLVCGSGFAQGVKMETSGNCSPAISGVGGNVTVNCNLTLADLRQNAESNLEKCLVELRSLLITQSAYLIPSISAYMNEPTDKNWHVVLEDVGRTQARLRAAITSAIDYDASLAVGGNLSKLHDTLRSRSIMLLGVPQRPPTREEAQQWVGQYRQLIARLQTEVEALRGQVRKAERKN